MDGHYSDLWQAIAAADPDRAAIIDVSGERWTYAEFTAQACALAATLRGAGIAPGDTVAMLLHNRPEFLITFYACLACGITPVPLNYRLRAGEIVALLDDSAASALIYPTSTAQVARDAVDAAARRPLTIAVEDAGPDADADADADATWRRAIATPATLPDHAPDDGEMWIYTGGTTGRPKAVRWLARDMFAVQLVVTYTMAGLDLPGDLADAVATALDPATPHGVNLPLAPFMHGTALTTSLNTLAIGGTVLTTSSARFDAEAAVRFAVAERATRLVVAGDAVALPLAETAERLGLRLDTVTSVMSSGMRFSPETKRQLHALGKMTIIDLLASSEGGAFAATTTTGAGDLPGRPQLLPTAVVFDERFQQVQDQVGALGLLGQRGAIPLGYHGDPEKTAATFPVIDGERFVVPGDWVRVEEDRYIEFLGRGSGVINTGGEKVYPQEVEEALLSHPAVEDAVVLGIPDPRFGEIVTAVVTVTDPPPSQADILAHVEAQLAGYKKPRHLMFRSSLDRTPTGKVNLAALRTEVTHDREGQTP